MMKRATFLAAAAMLAASATPGSAEMIYGLSVGDAGNSVVTFDSTTPGTVVGNRAITGVATGDILLGFDLRPATGVLYTLASSGNLYSLALSGSTYAASLIGDVGTLSGTRFGIDFNPVPDRLRVVSDFDQNLRINPNNAATTVDGTISAPGAEALTAVAYTNNRAGATSTTLYAIDASGNQQLVSTNPNAGTYNEVGTITVGGAAIDFGGTNNVGFDISGRTGIAYFNKGNDLYSLNLGNAQATFLGRIGGGRIIGITAAAVPEPATWGMMILGFGAVGATLRRRRKTQVRFA